MDILITPGSAAAPTTMRPHTLEVGGALRPYVEALVAVEVEAAGPLPLAVAPHDSMMLVLQFGRSSQPIEQKSAHGMNARLTGIRQWTGSFTGRGDCQTMFALLTPLGAVELLDSQPVDRLPRIQAPLAELLDTRLTRDLESQVALAHTLEERLRRFAAWLERRATSARRQSPAALRAGRAAMRLCRAPSTPMDEVAAEQCVSRRQLERDVGRWIGTSPRHLAQVARVQAVSRRARTGASLADIAADVGFADQAHMSRVVKQLTGLTPLGFTRSCRQPLATAFRHATRGATVYL